MKATRLLHAGIATVLLILLGTGCLPPPPHQHPKPPTPPGGPNATGLVHQNADKLPG